MVVSDEEWNQRILCSDGTCIGVIGKDGRCNECGKPYAGDLPLPTQDFGTADDPDASPFSPDETLSDSDECAEPDTPDEDWDQRTLCSDGTCIGVIGKDGRCNECGKPLSSESNASDKDSGDGAAPPETEDSCPNSSSPPCEVSHDRKTDAAD